ncbi:MAG TPA: endopeptidase La [Caldisericia bacterium]|nr:endopeptidase La [Caldisericia bacterium]HPB33809.1 endopeptidase La [Caldisericia bacterium]HQL66276.1 endopeptidase La [Caldisericia bacterium]HQN48660.1 endopeptidase La [Caldisericia bacterium]HQO99221.1 endopeptidase La [Caldisericia bacterium]
MMENKRIYPVLPLRNVVVFPNTVLPIFVGRRTSLLSLEESLKKDKLIVLITQKREEDEEPNVENLFEIGTLAQILQSVKLPDGSERVIVEAIKRIKIISYTKKEPFLEAEVEEIDEKFEKSPKLEALTRVTLDLYSEYVKLSKKIPIDTLTTIQDIDNPSRFADIVASNIIVPLNDKQKLLEILDVKERIEYLIKILSKEVELLKISSEIEEQVKSQVDKTQREYFLREQLKAIKKELGELEEYGEEVEEYREKIKKRNLPQYVLDKFDEELKKLSKMPPMAMEASVIRTYLDWILDLPWDIETKDEIDIKKAKKILDEDHYGLTDIKERIIEYLAVRRLTRKPKSPILCFIGPPGVGKTSLGKSIARALGRKFVHISLGGIRDEAEIRGHRRTYVGALPGRIIQGIKEANTKNPVFLLDEIDKVGVDFRGDPSAALLEALDPDQNSHFSDHFIEIPFDLSDVLFITTGNVTHTIPPALLDRMEIIYLPGYTEDEKLEIAKKYLFKKQLEYNGLTEKDVFITDEAYLKIIREYTRESGLRELERQIAKILRKTAKEKLEKGSKFKKVNVNLKNIIHYLEYPLYRFGIKEERDEVGVSTALSWTPFGGDITKIEVVKMKGGGKLILTGQLGDIMKESAQAAFSYIRAKMDHLKIKDKEFYKKYDFHVHVPEGAVPKDGPSAGIAIVAAMVSSITEIPIRKEVAMTGEITLSGKVLPIGGLKIKVLAAHRAGISEIVIPRENENDLYKIPESIKKSLKFQLIERVEEGIKYSLRS